MDTLFKSDVALAMYGGGMVPPASTPAALNSSRSPAAPSQYGIQPPPVAASKSNPPSPPHRAKASRQGSVADASVILAANAGSDTHVPGPADHVAPPRTAASGSPSHVSLAQRRGSATALAIATDMEPTPKRKTKAAAAAPDQPNGTASKPSRIKAPPAAKRTHDRDRDRSRQAKVADGSVNTSFSSLTSTTPPRHQQQQDPDLQSSFIASALSMPVGSPPNSDIRSISSDSFDQGDSALEPAPFSDASTPQPQAAPQGAPLPSHAAAGSSTSSSSSSATKVKAPSQKPILKPSSSNTTAPTAITARTIDGMVPAGMGARIERSPSTSSRVGAAAGASSPPSKPGPGAGSSAARKGRASTSSEPGMRRLSTSKSSPSFSVNGSQPLSKDRARAKAAAGDYRKPSSNNFFGEPSWEVFNFHTFVGTEPSPVENRHMKLGAESGAEDDDGLGDDYDYADYEIVTPSRGMFDEGDDEDFPLGADISSNALDGPRGRHRTISSPAGLDHSSVATNATSVSGSITSAVLVDAAAFHESLGGFGSGGGGGVDSRRNGGGSRSVSPRARALALSLKVSASEDAAETRSVASSPSYALSPVRRRKVDNGPIVRDRYGFKRSFEHVSKEDQEAFNVYYAGVCERRRAKWESLLRRSGGQLPPKSDRLKRYIRKGIPYELRTRCWMHYSGAAKDMEENPGLYSLLVYREEQDRSQGYTRENNKIIESIEAIERDLHRTFPDNIYFNPVQPDLNPDGSCTQLPSAFPDGAGAASATSATSAVPPSSASPVSPNSAQNRSKSGSSSPTARSQNPYIRSLRR
ncbi:hypothetical protein HK101_003374, partial [Irineochytrium annulatum]